MEVKNVDQKQNKWLKAAERYEAAELPGVRPRKKRSVPEKAIPSFAEFMASNEGEAGRRLLAASRREICLGYSESFMSETTSVLFTGRGLRALTGVVGEAAAYSKKEAVQTPIDVQKALDLLRGFPAEGNLLEEGDEETLVTNVCRELDEIAAVAP